MTVKLSQILLQYKTSKPKPVQMDSDTFEQLRFEISELQDRVVQNNDIEGELKELRDQDIRVEVIYSNPPYQRSTVPSTSFSSLTRPRNVKSTRKSSPVNMAVHLRPFLPEECIAELEALHNELRSSFTSKWRVYFELIRAILGLFWAYYFEVKLDNLWMRMRGEIREVEK